MANAGLGDDLLLANEVVDPDRLRRLAALDARVTIAVDSEATIDAAARRRSARGRHRRVRRHAPVRLPRRRTPGGSPTRARARGLTVRGVMGYEGHVVGRRTTAQRASSRPRRRCGCSSTRTRDVGGELVSGGGTGTFDINTWVTEIQAGSYALMDTAYGHLDLPFRAALSLVATVISVSEGWAVADCGLKSLGMDHGDPTVIGHTVWFCSDEHVTFGPETPGRGGRSRPGVACARRPHRRLPRADASRDGREGRRYLGHRPPGLVVGPSRADLSGYSAGVSLRRRLLLVFLAYLVIVVAGGALGAPHQHAA